MTKLITIVCFTVFFLCSVVYADVKKAIKSSTSPQLEVTESLLKDLNARINFLEKQLEESKRNHSDAVQWLNVYLCIFIGFVAIALGGIWWNNVVASKKLIGDALDRAKVDLLSNVSETLETQKAEYEVRFSLMSGNFYESLGRMYEEQKKYSIAFPWYVRAFNVYQDKDEEYVRHEYKGNVLGWILDCLNKMTEFTDGATGDELYEHLKGIDEKKFGLQKRKILARVEELLKSTPKPT